MTRDSVLACKLTMSRVLDAVANEANVSTTRLNRPASPAKKQALGLKTGEFSAVQTSPATPRLQQAVNL